MASSDDWSIWVQCEDARYYEDPVWEGPDWFLVFDYKDPPELVVTSEGRTPEEAQVYAKKILLENQFAVSNLRMNPYPAARHFGDVVRMAYSFTFTVSVRPRKPDRYSSCKTSPEGYVVEWVNPKKWLSTPRS